MHSAITANGFIRALQVFPLSRSGPIYHGIRGSYFLPVVANSWYMVGMANSDRATPTSTRRRVEPASLPTWVKPQLAALVTRAPDGPDWLHEMKLDGYRMHARLDAGRVKILTRRDDW